MKYIIYRLWIISLLFPLGMQAKVRLTSIWGDNMVLQQQSEVTFHGKATANSKITIEASWNHRKLTTLYYYLLGRRSTYIKEHLTGRSVVLFRTIEYGNASQRFSGTAGLWFTTLYRSCRLQTGITFVYSQKRLEYDS